MPARDEPRKMGNRPEKPSFPTNVEMETDEQVQEFANTANVAVIAFIAPYTSVRISPVQEISASISLPDEFGIETVVTELCKNQVKKAYLLVNSLGGSMTSSYKAARALRICLDEIVVFVPHIAASGGTLMALTGNKIVMGRMSHISPLDVQTHYKGTHISMATFQRFFARASEWFETITPEEAPYPQKAMTDRLDPFIMEEWSGVMETAIRYVQDILEKTGYKDSEKIAEQLVTGFPTHGYVITPDQGRDLGLNIEDSAEYEGEWKVMRHWLAKYLSEETPFHCIRYFIPSQKETNHVKEKGN